MIIWQIAHTLESILPPNSPSVQSRHRIIDVEGRVHHVVVVGDLLRDDNEIVIGTHGVFYIDATPSDGYAKTSYGSLTSPRDGPESNRPRAC